MKHSRGPGTDVEREHARQLKSAQKVLDGSVLGFVG